MEPLSIFISFAFSYLANNVPTIIDLVNSNKSFDSRLKDCYDRARKRWKCQAARDRYEGKEMSYLSDLKNYLAGNMDNLDLELQELMGRWVMEMRNDKLCSAFISEIKIDEIKGMNSEAVNGIRKAIESIDVKLDNLADKIDDVNESLRTIAKKIDSISSFETKIDVVIRELFRLLQDEAGDIMACTATVLSHGGIEWWGMAENKRALRNQIELLRDYVIKYQVYIDNELYEAVISHCNLAIKVQCELDDLVMAIFSADDQDGITAVYYLTYDRSIEWTSSFVSDLMNEFRSVDEHYIYEEYSGVFREHEESVGKLSTIIKEKIGKAYDSRRGLEKEIR